MNQYLTYYNITTTNTLGEHIYLYNITSVTKNYTIFNYIQLNTNFNQGIITNINNTSGNKKLYYL